MWYQIFAGVYFCGLAFFFGFAGTNFDDLDTVIFLAEN